MWKSTRLIITENQSEEQLRKQLDDWLKLSKQDLVSSSSLFQPSTTSTTISSRPELQYVDNEQNRRFLLLGLNVFRGHRQHVTMTSIEDAVFHVRDDTD